MFQFITRAIIRHRLQTQVERERQYIEKLYREVAHSTATADRPYYNVTAELWLLCRDLDTRDGDW